MTKTSQPPATQKEHHLWNRKKSYFSEVCLWDTSLLTMISDSFKTTSWKIYRTSKILSNIFPHLLVKTEGRDGESATQRKQTWNYLFWLELCVLLANMEKGNSKHYLYAGQNLLIFLDHGFSISVSLYVMELHRETIWYKSLGSFKSLYNTNLDASTNQALTLLPLTLMKIY